MCESNVVIGADFHRTIADVNVLRHFYVKCMYADSIGYRVQWQNCFQSHKELFSDPPCSSVHFILGVQARNMTSSSALLQSLSFEHELPRVCS
jgi:hypothetical protein